METTMIGSVRVAYQIRGRGPLVVYTPGAFWGIGRSAPVVRAFLDNGYRTLVYDRINTHNSGFDFTQDDLRDIWADQIHSLIGLAGGEQAVICGGSGGLATSLYFAHKYPNEVRSLCCISPGTTAAELARTIADKTFVEPADSIAGSGVGVAMENGAGLFEWQSLSEISRAELRKINPSDIERALRVWASWPNGVNWTYGGLADAEIKELKCPAIVLSGIDDIHTEDAAVHLAALLPNARLVARDEYGSKIDVMRRDIETKGGEFFDARLVRDFIAPFLSTMN